ncbi:ATP-binding protein [Streptomyces sp.]|uniref:ATP-binding protein n=1 Tax=Streptomyces sp. TaxID=1931 RepID=UPI0025D300C9|nr:ATP-binding protein [Streptomyces sp.]
MTTHLELHLAATPKAAPELRHRLRDHTFDVRLCATELLTNVIEHVGEGAPVTVRVMGTHEHGRTRIEVTDSGPRTLPALLPATSTEESGRGLAVLDALTDRWGVDRGPDRSGARSVIRPFARNPRRGCRRKHQQAGIEDEEEDRCGPRSARPPHERPIQVVEPERRPGCAQRAFIWAYAGRSPWSR